LPADKKAAASVIIRWPPSLLEADTDEKAVAA